MLRGHICPGLTKWGQGMFGLVVVVPQRLVLVWEWRLAPQALLTPFGWLQLLALADRNLSKT